MPRYKEYEDDVCTPPAMAAKIVERLAPAGWLCDQPKAWGSRRTGFRLAVAHFQRGVDGPAETWAPTFERLEPLAA